MVFAARNQETIIGKRTGRIEIEYKYQVFPTVCQYLVAIVMPNFYHIGLLDIFYILQQMNHSRIEITQIMITQSGVVYQMPLAACIFVRPAVAFTREVNPFGMTELVTHEIQITAVDCRSRKQADHLVQCDAAFYRSIFVTNAEMPIHIGINQTENDGLIAHQCLVVAFAI